MATVVSVKSKKIKKVLSAKKSSPSKNICINSILYEKVRAIIKKKPYLKDHIRTRGTKPKGEFIVTSMLTV